MMRSFFQREQPQDIAALVLRVGLGVVFVIGGWSKLSQLLDPQRAEAIVATYIGGKGYINGFFLDYLFTGALGSVLSPWLFLTSLSAFELVAGCMLVAGVLVRPLAIVWGLLLWTFVIALPVNTVAGGDPGLTHTAPALLVQVGDVALSGLFFALYNLGSGSYSLDKRSPDGAHHRLPWSAERWDHLGLLVRLSVALPLLVGGFFHGLPYIKTYAMPALPLLAVGALLAAGMFSRAAGAAVAAIMVIFMIGKLNFDSTLIANLNSFKREFAFVAAGAVLAWLGGGKLFAVPLSFRRKSAAPAAI